jgi:hypothetical protein
MRMKKELWRISLVWGVAMLPGVVFAQNTAWLNSVSSGLLEILRAVGVMLAAAAVAVFVWGIVMFIGKAGDEKARIEGKRRMVWGIVSLFMLTSVWGFVALLQSITNIEPEEVVAPRSR